MVNVDHQRLMEQYATEQDYRSMLLREVASRSGLHCIEDQILSGSESLSSTINLANHHGNSIPFSGASSNEMVPASFRLPTSISDRPVDGHLRTLEDRIAHQERYVEAIRKEVHSRKKRQQSLQSLVSDIQKAARHRRHVKSPSNSTKDHELLPANPMFQQNSTTQVGNGPPQLQASTTQSIPLSMPEDKHCVSPYQQLLRDSLEFFIVSKEDHISNAYGRGDGIPQGQVGIRCRFCKHRAMHWRGKGSLYFPGKVVAIYQSAQNIGSNHLLTSCSDFPEDRKEEMLRLRKANEKKHVGAKRYWEECCRFVGIYDRLDKQGIWLMPSPPSAIGASERHTSGGGSR